VENFESQEDAAGERKLGQPETGATTELLPPERFAGAVAMELLPGGDWASGWFNSLFFVPRREGGGHFRSGW